MWAVPVKGGTDKMDDPFEDAALKKKQRVIKNKLNQLKNLVRPACSAPVAPALLRLALHDTPATLGPCHAL